MNQIKREAYPLIFKVISDAELMLTKLTGSRIYLKMDVKGDVVSQSEANKIWLQNYVCTEFKITWADMIGNKRKRNLVDARKVYSFLAYNFLRLSLMAIAADLRKDHTSILYLKRRCEEHIEMKDDLGTHIANIQKSLYENIS